MKKQVTRIHTCILHVGVMQWLIQNVSKPDGPSCGTIEFMTMPPPDRLISSRTVVPAHPLPDGSIMTKIEVTELEDVTEDDINNLQWKGP